MTTHKHSCGCVYGVDSRGLKVQLYECLKHAKDGQYRAFGRHCYRYVESGMLSYMYRPFRPCDAVPVLNGLRWKGPLTPINVPWMSGKLID